MNKTIKVIDLLNKIANGEEVHKFWWNGCIHEIEKDMKTNKCFIFDTYCGKYKEIELENLNDEVAIIEDKEDINIQDIEHKELEIIQENLGKCDLWKGNEEYILKVINENNSRLVDAILQVSKENGVLVQAVKQLDKTKEDK